MRRRAGVWLYALVVSGLFNLIPLSAPALSASAHAGLLFGYLERPFNVMLFCTFDLVFDYVTIRLPAAELAAIRTFYLLRKPTLRRVYTANLWLLLPYFIPFLGTKLLVLTLWKTPLAWLWIGLSLGVWLAWVMISRVRQTIPQSMVLVVLIGMRVLAHYWL